jgi:ATP-binding cassette, subfamily B, vacuolar membrane transporter HMT1/ACLQ
VYSVYQSRSEEELNGSDAKGPGGHTLPASRHNSNNTEDDAPSVSPTALRIFRYITSAVVLTFIANGGAIILHVMAVYAGNHGSSGDYKHYWWCEQSRLVWSSQTLAVPSC